MNRNPAPGRKELSHIRILEVASRAIRRHGFNNVSVADVMKEAGLTHGGFYAHFDSRDDMLAEAIAFGGTQSSDALSKAVAREVGKRGGDAFGALVHVYLSDAHMTGVAEGCLVAALGSEMPRQAPQVHHAATERIQALVKRVEDSLPDGVPRSSAAAVASAMVGALQLARALGGKEGREVLANTRRALLDQYRRAGQPSSA